MLVPTPGSLFIHPLWGAQVSISPVMANPHPLPPVQRKQEAKWTQFLPCVCSRTVSVISGKNGITEEDTTKTGYLFSLLILLPFTVLWLVLCNS